MLTKLLVAPLLLLGIATVAFSFGVGCAGSLYYKPRIQKERSALVHYKAQLAMAHTQLIETQAKVVIQTEIQYRERINRHSATPLSFFNSKHSMILAITHISGYGYGPQFFRNSYE